LVVIGKHCKVISSENYMRLCLRQAVRSIHAQPAIVAIEIAWRWSFGLIATVLLILGAKAFLAGLKVSPGDAEAIRGANPTILAAALMHLFQQQGVWQRFLGIAFAVVVPTVLVWIGAATLGRVAVLKRIFERPEMDVVAVLYLTIARVLLVFVCIAVWYVWMVICAFVTVSGELPNYPLYLLLSFLALPVITITWGVLNWILSLAPILVARDGFGAMQSYRSTVQLARKERAGFFSVTSWLGCPRLVALIAGVIFAGIIVAVFQSAVIATILLTVITLAYCAFADYLYVVRLVAYGQIEDKTVPVESNSLLHQQR
jgi:hypothetical protein